MPTATWGEYASPPLWVTLARPDAGKTWDSGNAMGSRGLYIGSLRGMDSVFRGPAGLGVPLDTSAWALTTQGWQGGQVAELQLFRDVVQLLETYAEVYSSIDPADRPFVGVVIDDASLLLKNEKARVWTEIPDSGRGTFDRWDRLSTLLTRFFVAAEAASLFIYMSMHHSEYKEADAKRKIDARIGGPETVGPKLTLEIAYRASTVGLAEVDPLRWPRNISYKAPLNVDPRNLIKDRLNQLRGTLPFNTRELLMRAGASLPVDAPWQEELTDQVVDKCRNHASYNPSDAWTSYKHVYSEVFPKLLDQGVDGRLAHRALYNGFCREELRRSDKGYFHSLLQQARAASGGGIGASSLTGKQE